jgi:hypothetical protein
VLYSKRRNTYTCRKCGQEFKADRHNRKTIPVLSGVN